MVSRFVAFALNLLCIDQILTPPLILSQGPPGLLGLKGDTGIKGEKVRNHSMS